MNSNPSDAEDIPEQSFGIGPRGRRARASSGVARGRSGVVGWVPLLEFPWTGPDYRIASDLWIRTGSAYSGFEMDDIARFLSEDEKARCRSARHWLEITSVAHSDPSTHGLLNCFLLSLWMIRPTRTHAVVRFEENISGVPAVSRLLGRFQWIEGYVAETLSEDDLSKTAALFAIVRESWARHGRLADALVLTLHARMTHQWKPAFIYFATVLEALLTHRDEGENTADLAGFYGALLGGSSPEARDFASHFYRLYSLRHDILHGHPHDLPSEDNLKRLAEMSDLVRLLWRRVLLSEPIREALDRGDRERRTLLTAAQSPGTI